MNESGVILLVEDDKNILRTNRRILEREGFTVLCAETLAGARKQFAAARPDVLVLDIMLPDGSGLDFCEEIRGGLTAPVLFLTALDEEDSVIQGLTAGGSDYITKPYKVEELTARIKAQLLLARRNRAAQEKSVVRGPLTLDLTAQRAYLRGRDMLLAQKEFALLLYLMKHENEGIERQALYETVWRQPMADDDSAVKNAVYRLRKKLEGSGFTITARRGEGYQFEEI